MEAKKPTPEEIKATTEKKNEAVKTQQIVTKDNKNETQSATIPKQ